MHSRSLAQTIESESDNKYVGEINADGEPHGKGASTYKSGSKYDGAWENDKRHVVYTNSGNTYDRVYNKARKPRPYSARTTRRLRAFRRQRTTRRRALRSSARQCG